MILTALLPSWKLVLNAANKSPKTIVSYLDSVKRLEAYLATQEMPLDAPGIPGGSWLLSGTARRQRRLPSTTGTSLCTSAGW
jgi:hypothetical protein